MPKKILSKLNQKSGSRRRQSILGLAIAASLGIAGCNSDNSTGSTNNDGGGSGGDNDGGSGGDLALPPDPPPGSHRVTVAIDTGGTAGSVISQPAGISCGTGTMQCAGDFTDGTQVILTAAGIGTSSFTGWTGACAGQGAACTLTIGADVMTTAKFGAKSCSPDSVCWEAPLPFGYDLNGVAAVAANNVWAVGNAGAIVHYDGNAWTHVASGTTANLVDVWARNANDIWAIANPGFMLHWNGTAWSNVPTGAYSYIGTSVWGTAAKVYVATTQYILSYDGATWTRTDPGVRNDTPFVSITGTADNDVWAFATDDYICHYTTGWSCLKNNPGNFDHSTAAISLATNDIWEVTSDAYVSHNTGTTPGSFPLPVTGTQFAPSASGLWGVRGATTTLFSNGPGAMLYRYNGTAWQPNATGVLDVTILNKIHGTSATDVWSVGTRGVIAHWNGTAATVNRGNTFSGGAITGVWASGANDAWFTTSARTVVRYNGASFTESAPLVTLLSGRTKTIWGTSPTDVWVGGNNGNGPGMFHWTGSAWASVPQPAGFTGSNVDSVYMASQTLGFAAGDPATGVEKWNGTAWQPDLTLTGTNPITKVWGAGTGYVLALETNSMKLWQYNGVTWSTDGRVMDKLYSVGGSGASDVWLGATQGVYHYNGSAWTAKLPIAGSVGTIDSVSSVSATEAWAVDSNGSVFHTTNGGTTWTPIDTGVTSNTQAAMNIYSVNANLTWLGGKSGILSIRH